jgi:hypothetical protein
MEQEASKHLEWLIQFLPELSPQIVEKLILVLEESLAMIINWEVVNHCCSEDNTCQENCHSAKIIS